MIYSKSEELPKVQQWALINKRKAEQEQKILQIQRLQHFEKMKKFKQGLDQQISQRGDPKKFQKEEEKKYYQISVQKRREFLENEEKMRQQKLRKRKQMEDQNERMIEEIINSRSRVRKTKGFRFQIGRESEEKHKAIFERRKMEMMEGLKRQVEEKNEKMMKQKMQELQLGRKHQQVQPSHFESRKKQKMKEYKQSPEAYNNYARLMAEKNHELEQMQRKITDDSRQKYLQNLRKQRSDKWKHNLQENMKDSLQKQVKVFQSKKEEERRGNPEDYSFNFMSQVFKNKYPTYNKHKYYEELRQQAEEQKKRKKKDFFMSEEEYKLNKNQLHNIVNGRYAHAHYLDRSLGAIGENKRANSLLNRSEDEQSLFVKNKLEHMKGRYSPEN